VTNGSLPEITALIATVSDPLHGHLELDFDRSIDALIQAAAGSHYVPSYYWLPWKPESGKESAEPSKEAEDRSHQPGLIIFKYAPQQGEDLAQSYHRVIYLFLVGETPALGLDGQQMQAALSAEHSLLEEAEDTCPWFAITKTCERAVVHFSMGPKSSNEIAILGPRGSGTAASMRVALEHEHYLRRDETYDVTGWATLPIARQIIDSKRTENAPLPLGGHNPLVIHYRSFGENTVEEGRVFHDILKRSKYAVSRTVFLAEEGTVFGSTYQADHQAENESFLTTTYPRGVSLLRNAQTNAAGKPDTTPSPYLAFTLKDSNGSDTIPQFSAVQTPISQESRLLALARDFHDRRIQFIAISSSNILDEFFLAEFFHRTTPDAQLVFFGGGDLMFNRPTGALPFVGAISLTAYALAWPARHISDRMLEYAFPDSETEALYNAASYVFWDKKPGSLPKLLGYEQIEDSCRRTLLPTLWAVTAGRDGDYLMGLLHPKKGDPIVPEISTKDCHGCTPDRSLREQKVLDGIVIDPSLSWFALCLGATLLCWTHIFFIKTARYWSPTTHDFDIRENDHPRRRCIYIHIGTAMLVIITFVTAFPLYGTSGQGGTATGEAIGVAWLTFASGIATLVATLTKTHRYILRPHKSSPEDLDLFVPVSPSRIRCFARTSRHSPMLELVVLGRLSNPSSALFKTMQAVASKADRERSR
jgi:hypothetical protein